MDLKFKQLKRDAELLPALLFRDDFFFASISFIYEDVMVEFANTFISSLVKFFPLTF